jgi:hypothetical protein
MCLDKKGTCVNFYVRSVHSASILVYIFVSVFSVLMSILTVLCHFLCPCSSSFRSFSYPVLCPFFAIFKSVFARLMSLLPVYVSVSISVLTIFISVNISACTFV